MSVESHLDESLQWTPEYSVGLLNYNDKVLGEGLNTAEAREVRKRSIQALRKAPLSDRPFVQLGEASIFLNSDNVDRKLFVESKRRNIRNRRALRILINLDAKDENFDEAVHNLDILLGLNAIKTHNTDYHNALTLLSRNPVARETIDKYLEQRAPWGKKFLTTQIGLMTDKNFRDVEKSLKAYSVTGADDRLNSYYLTGLMDLEKIDAGFEYWTGLEGSEYTAEDYTVFNPNFEKRTALPPFNWQEIDHRKYFSEIDQAGGLYASFADSVVRTLTQQILHLEPGMRYTLNVDADWTYRRRQGMFYWEITCLPSNQVISEFYLDENNKGNSGGETSFQVPVEACVHQSLRLKAKSGQYSQRIWSRTNALNIAAQ